MAGNEKQIQELIDVVKEMDKNQSRSFLNGDKVELFSRITKLETNDENFIVLMNTKIDALSENIATQIKGVYKGLELQIKNVSKSVDQHYNELNDVAKIVADCNVENAKEFGKTNVKEQKGRLKTIMDTILIAGSIGGLFTTVIAIVFYFMNSSGKS